MLTNQETLSWDKCSHTLEPMRARDYKALTIKSKPPFPKGPLRMLSSAYLHAFASLPRFRILFAPSDLVQGPPKFNPLWPGIHSLVALRLLSTRQTVQSACPLCSLTLLGYVAGSVNCISWECISSEIAKALFTVSLGMHAFYKHYWLDLLT